MERIKMKTVEKSLDSLIFATILTKKRHQFMLEELIKRVDATIADPDDQKEKYSEDGFKAYAYSKFQDPESSKPS
jgi:hypothetical protein